MIKEERVQMVVAFLIHWGHVLLIRKNRPDWQKGLLNGVGGKVEAGESPLDAIRREVREETGLRIVPEYFHKVVEYYGQGVSGVPYVVYFYAALDVPIEQAEAMTDEALETHPVYPLPPDTIPNLRWLIPLVLDNRLQTPIVIHDHFVDGDKG